MVSTGLWEGHCGREPSHSTIHDHDVGSWYDETQNERYRKRPEYQHCATSGEQSAEESNLINLGYT